jgi:DNA-binding transcriptional LysR family regulator
VSGDHTLSAHFRQYKNFFDGACSRAGFQPRLSVRTEQGPSALNLARAGLGLALVPGNIIPPHINARLGQPAST